MPKIRGVKPEYWTDDAIVELSIPARLLFIGLWNYACDNGHLDDKPRQIKMRLFPADDVDVDALLSELEVHGRITRVAGVITIPKFADHQRPHKRWWTTCDQPLCTVPDDAPPQGRNGGATVEQPLSNRGATVTDVTDGDGDVDRAPERRNGGRSRGTRINPGFALTDDLKTWADEKGYTHLDLEGITEEFVDYWRSVPGAKGTKLDWSATWRGWVRRKADDVKVRPLRRAVGDQRPEGW